MYTHRRIIVSFLCATTFISTISAQQTDRAISTPGNSVGQTYREQQITPQRTQVGQRNDQPNDDRQLPARPAATPGTNVVPGQNNRPNQNVIPAPKNDRVNPGIPGRDRLDNRVVPGAQVTPGSHVVPGSGSVVPGRVPNGSAIINGGAHVVPGTRPLGQRPLVITRPLPQTIVIDRRCAPCPYVTLTPYAVSKKGDMVELSDGSVWEVRHRDRRAVRRWSPGDTILVETGKFLSWSSYRLVNYSRHESADVELALASGFEGRFSHWITEVNPIQGYVRLEDGSIWRMSSSEVAMWRVNDDVIIGLSKDWFSDQYSYILINPRARNRIIALFEF